jgi:predicted nucleotidyltransferase component of viral defense system
LLLYRGIKGARYRIKYTSPDFKYPFVIRLDFSKESNLLQTETTVLSTGFPISQLPIISHLAKREMIAEKINALYERNKGKDFFDVWMILKSGELPDWNLIQKKSKKSFEKDILLDKIVSFPDKKLSQDLAQFLPRTQKKIIPMIKKDLIRFFHQLQPKLMV